MKKNLAILLLAVLLISSIFSPVGGAGASLLGYQWQTPEVSYQEQQISNYTYTGSYWIDGKLSAIQRSDGAGIPIAEGNMDYQQYLTDVPLSSRFPAFDASKIVIQVPAPVPPDLVAMAADIAELKVKVNKHETDIASNFLILDDKKLDK